MAADRRTACARPGSWQTAHRCRCDRTIRSAGRGRRSSRYRSRAAPRSGAVANTFPAPAVWASAPSNTRRPLSSLFMPSSMKLRMKRPLWEMPKPSAWGGRAVSPPPQRRVRGALGIGAVVAQKRHQVPGGGEADADHLRRRRVVPQFIDRNRLELPAGGQKAHRPVGLEAPGAARNFGSGVTFPGADGQPSPRRIEGSGRIGEPGPFGAGIAAGAEV
jgi:hypothetical protein